MSKLKIAMLKIYDFMDYFFQSPAFLSIMLEERFKGSVPKVLQIMIASVSFFFQHKTKEAESIADLLSLIKDYLVDQEAEIRCLITWFLNLVMDEEAISRSVQNVTRGHLPVKLVETATSLEPLLPGRRN